ncbi:hypothetical protein STEG23_036801, partial [Scotinomys teguina]
CCPCKDVAKKPFPSHPHMTKRSFHGPLARRKRTQEVLTCQSSAYFYVSWTHRLLYSA